MAYNVTATHVDTTTGKRYFVCQKCNYVNTIEDFKNESRRKKYKWQIFTNKNVKDNFKQLSARLGMSYEEAILYLMKLDEKEQNQMYNAVSVAGLPNK
jgi:hypothetical protein